MAWYKRILSAIERRPSTWLGALAVGLLAVSVWSGFALFAIAAVLIVWTIYIRAIASIDSRQTFHRLDEIGEIQLEIAECAPTGLPNESTMRKLFPFFAVGYGLSYAAILYRQYENNSGRLLVTDKGLFRLVDPIRLWPPGRSVVDTGNPQRALRLHSWDDIARFHWSQQQGQHLLHLNVRQSGFSVPQLVSYRFPSMTEPQWHQLAQILQTSVATPVAA
jgi:hypothetical protein